MPNLPAIPTGLKFTFVAMSVQVGKGRPYGWDYNNAERPTHLPLSSRTWGPSICEKLAERGHETEFVQIETRDFIRRYFRGGLTVSENPVPGYRIFYTADEQLVRRKVDGADIILLRHHYANQAKLFSRLDLKNKPVVQILCASPETELQFRPQTEKYTLMVNSEMERKFFHNMGIASEIFLKPAGKAYYVVPESPPKKEYDVAFVTWDTALPRKRFDLLLSALELASRRGTHLEVAVVGATREHDPWIEKINAKGSGKSIHRLGNLPPDEVKRTFLRSRISVMPSSLDGNPQVIAESLACNTPVACARDLAGGAFQIKTQCGELFDPTPEGLLETILHMHSRLDQFQPRRHCITLDDAVDQIEQVVRTAQVS